MASTNTISMADLDSTSTHENLQEDEVFGFDAVDRTNHNPMEGSRSSITNSAASAAVQLQTEANAEYGQTHAFFGNSVEPVPDSPSDINTRSPDDVMNPRPLHYQSTAPYPRPPFNHTTSMYHVPNLNSSTDVHGGGAYQGQFQALFNSAPPTPHSELRGPPNLLADMARLNRPLTRSYGVQIPNVHPGNGQYTTYGDFQSQYLPEQPDFANHSYHGTVSGSNSLEDTVDVKSESEDPRGKTAELSAEDLLHPLQSGADTDTIFANAVDAEDWRFETAYAQQHPQDPSLPQTPEQKKAIVKALFRAMRSIAEAKDNPAMLKPFIDKKHRKQRIEVVCWQILDATIQRHTSGPLQSAYGTERVKSSGQVATFRGRLDHILRSLKTQKTICKHLLDPRYLHTFVDDPEGARRRVEANKELNRRKGEVMELGKKALKDGKKDEGVKKNSGGTTGQVGSDGEYLSMDSGTESGTPLSQTHHGFTRTGTVDSDIDDPELFPESSHLQSGRTLKKDGRSNTWTASPFDAPVGYQAAAGYGYGESPARDMQRIYSSGSGQSYQMQSLGISSDMSAFGQQRGRGRHAQPGPTSAPRQITPTTPAPSSSRKASGASRRRRDDSDEEDDPTWDPRGSKSKKTHR